MTSFKIKLIVLITTKSSAITTFLLGHGEGVCSGAWGNWAQGSDPSSGQSGNSSPMGRVWCLWWLQLEVEAIYLIPQTACHGEQPASKCHPQPREGKASGHLSITERDALDVNSPFWKSRVGRATGPGPERLPASWQETTHILRVRFLMAYTWNSGGVRMDSVPLNWGINCGGPI